MNAFSKKFRDGALKLSARAKEPIIDKRFLEDDGCIFLSVIRVRLDSAFSITEGL